MDLGRTCIADYKQALLGWPDWVQMICNSGFGLYLQKAASCIDLNKQVIIQKTMYCKTPKH